MFFSEKIISIKPTDKVLEIGPGATPHKRSNAFLELNYIDSKDRVSQRGGGTTEPKFGNKPLYFYDGINFPFKNNEFDYIICSHVVEHVPDPIHFMSEIFRVGGGRGYIEYPMITYEYLYNFDVHQHFVKFDFLNETLRYIPKKNTSFFEFIEVQAIYLKTLERGWDELCSFNKKLFFEGFEFNQPFKIVEESNIDKLLPSAELITKRKFTTRILIKLINKLGL